jgi:hypothetical protein
MGMTMSASNQHQSTDPTLQPRVRAHVVYDTTNGEILHIHHSVTFGRDSHLSEPPEERARRLASGRAKENAAVLEVDPAELAKRTSIRIDVVTRKIVAQ